MQTIAYVEVLYYIIRITEAGRSSLLIQSCYPASSQPLISFILTFHSDLRQATGVELVGLQTKLTG